MTNEHVRRESVYRVRYRPYQPFGPDNCAYCGDPAQCHDHCPPLAAIPVLDLTSQKIKYRLLPSCLDCNARLGRSMAATVRKRRAVIIASLTKRYRRMLRKVVWDDDEMAELGWNLKSYVESSENRHRWLMARLATLRNGI